VKENDLMVEQCLADLANDLVGEWPGEIDASDFGAKRARNPLSENRVVIHRASSLQQRMADQGIVAIYELWRRGNSSISSSRTEPDVINGE